MKKFFIVTAIVTYIGSCSPKTAPVIAEDNSTHTNTTADVASGQSTYNAKCGNCHKLKKTANYTAERWVKIMNVMAPKARLNETEKANVLAYVTTNAKK